jgi:hypothetical protein
MTLTLELAPELVATLRSMAEQAGLEPDRYIARALQQHVQQQASPAAQLSRDETELLQKIGQGLPPETWARYQALKEKRDARTLTPDEYAELLALTHQVEQWNARRLELVAALARLRQVPLREMMNELGLTPAPYA